MTYTRPISASLLTSGLAGTLGYTVKDAAGSVLVARTTAGITEDGTSANYWASVASWDSSWSGRIVWDAGAGTLAAEDFLAVLYTGPPAPADYQQRGVAVTLPALPAVTLAAGQDVRNVTGTVTDKAGYALSAAGLDALSAADPGAPANHTTLPRMLVALYRRFYRKHGKTPTAITLYKDDGTTANATQPIADNGSGTQTVGAAT